MAGASSCLSFLKQQLCLLVALMAILGVFGALVGVPMQTTIQAETPEEMRGKVFGLQNNAVNIALSLPLVLAGLVELSVLLLTLASDRSSGRSSNLVYCL